MGPQEEDKEEDGAKGRDERREDLGVVLLFSVKNGLRALGKEEGEEKPFEGREGAGRKTGRRRLARLVQESVSDLEGADRGRKR
jgi:hypothetical protein